MKETQFIEQNKDKWLEFEQAINNADKDPDKLHDVFIQVTDDLSYARTFYATRSVRVYLNGVAQMIFGDIYKQKKSPLSKIKYFFVEELPQVVYESRWSFFWAIVFFTLSFAIGYFSSVKDPEFAKLIMGDEYVRMTAENIKSGDPMKVYKESGRFDMTFGIMENNMRVTLMYFIFGIFAGIGSVAMMMYNGIMVGCFLQFFAQNNLLQEANLTIWMHGTLEISAIVIGTAAGITMGRSLLFPGTYSRLQAFQMSARRGIKIMAGVMVMLFFAALIEGNLTRHTEFGDGFRAAFIAINLGAILFYFGWLPFYKAKKGFKKPFKEAKLPPDSNYTLVFNKIKNSGDIFNDTFTFFKTNAVLNFKMAGALSMAFCVLVFGLSPEAPEEIFKLDAGFLEQVKVLVQFFATDKVWFMPILSSIFMAILALGVYRLLLKTENTITKTRQQDTMAFLKMVLITSIFGLVAQMGVAWFSLLFFVVLPFLCLWLYLCYRDGLNIFAGIQHTQWLMGSGWGLSYATHFIMLTMSYLLFSALSSGFLYLYLTFIGWNMSFVEQAKFDNIVVMITTFVNVFVFYINLLFFFTANGFLYYSLLEVNSAQSLLDKIKEVGMGKKIQGLARE